MAQLPPKAPTMTSHSHHYHNNCPSFSNYHQMLPSPPSAAPPPFWVDEFLDFSSSRRNSHRRSVSDPIAFAEVQFGDEHNTNTSSTNNNVVETFERLDDEQLCSMFSDDVTPAVPSSSNPSTNDPSTTSTDQKSEDEEKVMTIQQLKKEPGEVESDECRPEMQSHRPADKDSGETIISDPKRVKRILANRQSAQRSRVRKLQYISELERSVTSLQTEVSALSPRVAFLDHQRLILNVDNSALKQRIAALAQDKLFKDAHQEALKKEIDRLRKVYHEQSIINNNNNNVDDDDDDDNNNSAGKAPQPPDSAATSDQQPQQQHH